MNTQKTTTSQRSIFRWPVIALAIFGVVGTYFGILALIQRDYLMFGFWFIVGDIPAAIVLTMLLVWGYRRYAARRTINS